MNVLQRSLTTSVAEGRPRDVLLTHAEDPKSAAPESGISSVRDVPGVKEEGALLPELDVDQVLAGRVDDVVPVGVLGQPSAYHE